MADNQLQINIGADTRNLEQGLQRATAEVEAFDKSVKKTTASSGKAGLALSNLGRVASDAPFGFIAIQNNIEPLLQSFQSLSKESGGAGGALKALGKSLVGPTGLLLGFSLVSSAITVAIQKYGSLGAAINAIFGQTDTLNKEVLDAAKSYEKFNEQLKNTQSIQGQAAASTQGEISRVQALAGIVSNQTRSYNERNNALNELQKINKTYFGDIDLEGDKLATLTSRVEDYTRANVQAAISKAFESEIAATSVELSKQERVLGKLVTRLGETATAQNKVSQTLPGIAQAAEQSRVGSAAINATEAYIQQNTTVNELRGRIKELNDELNKSVNSYNSITAPINAANEAQRKKAEQDKKEAEAAARLTAELNRQAEARRKSLAAILAEAGQRQTLDFTSFFDLDEGAARAKYSKLFAPVQSAFEEALAPSRGQLARDIQIVPSASVQQAISSLNTVRENVQLVSNSFSTFLAPAIDSAFSALANGTSVIDAVKNSLKGLLAQLAANAAKALLLKAALSFVPGAGALAGGGGAGIGGLLSGLLGGGGFGRLAGAAAPTFSGVGGFGGGLQLAGQVVFRQRGADLVGVLNTQNGRINRVG